ncbi:MAG: DUF1351 domain-containing protein [Rheinheimera sp.]|nr:DUF1351 domain-containing protein [Rheinheimera sp.]
MSAVEAVQIEESPVPATELMCVQSTPAVISVNFVEIKEALSEALKKHDVVVTADTLVGAKKLKAELNKNATEFDKRRKAAIEQVSGPIKEFDAQMKELTAMCKGSVGNLDSQITVFETETLNNIRNLLGEALGREWDALNVSAEFRNSNINDLVLLGSITSTGKLTGKVANDIKSRALDDKGAENTIKLRLSELENRSYRAGLKAPLTRAHVEVFLFAPEADYSQRLEAMLQSEVQRQEKAEAQLREQMAQEQERNRQAQELAEQRIREANERARQAEENAQRAAEQAAQQQAAPVEQHQEPAPSQQATTPQSQALKVYYAPMSDKVVKLNAPSFEQAAQAAIESQQADGQQYAIRTKEDGLIGIVHAGRVFWRA